MSYVWSMFTTEPVQWLTVAWGGLTSYVAVTKKPNRPAVLFILSGLSFAIAAWTLSMSRDLQSPSLRWAGVGWLLIFVAWGIGGAVRWYKQRKAKAPTAGAAK